MNRGNNPVLGTVTMRAGAITARIILIVVALVSIVGCPSPQEELTEGESLYELPDFHPDNDHPLKHRFFQEPFRDLDGRMVQLDSLVGVPFVIVMFPSFLTVDGRTSLVGLEALQRQLPGQFRTVFVPYEDAETVRPTIMSDPEGVLFLFRANGAENPSLADKYSGFFWNPDIIEADYPEDRPGMHTVGPFYWVVDESGTIREKLIDYSNMRGVEMSELKEVLEALLGPAGAVETSPEPPVSVSGDEDEVQFGTTEDSQG